MRHAAPKKRRSFLPKNKAVTALATFSLLSLSSVTQAQAVGTQSTNSGWEIARLTPQLSTKNKDVLADWYGHTIGTNLKQHEAFYQIPDELPETNGSLIKSESINFFLEPTYSVRGPVKSAQRIMYKSTDYQGNPMAVTGVALESQAWWPWWRGERPVIAFAPGTQGLGDACAPSNQLETGTEYEGLAISALLNAGYNVVVTDYHGSGTEGTHSYLNRVDQGNAVLDAARVAQDLGLASDTTPVGIWGYSQGGGAAASAGELQEDYAPELNVKGIFAGAAPADLKATLKNIDGTTYNAFMLMGIAGLGDSYNIDLGTHLSPAGMMKIDKIRNSCLGEAIADSGSVTGTQGWTLTGQKVSDVVSTDAELSKILEENSLGRRGRRPAAPIFIASSYADDVIPYQTNRDLAKRYCHAGAHVSFYTSISIGHAGASLGTIPAGLIFMDQVFWGQEPLDACWQF